MQKRFLSLFLALVLLLALAPCAFAEDSISDEQELLRFLAAQKKDGAEEFEFTCDKAFFDRLLADSASLLSILEIKAGIGDARVRYSEQGCLIRMSRVKYSDAPWAECRSEKDAGLAVQRILRARPTPTGFHLLCSPELARSLANSANLRNYAAQAGYSLQFQYYTSGVIEATSVKPFTGAYAPVEDVAQFDAAIEAFAEQELDEFYIVFDPAFYQKLAEDEEQRNLLHATSMLDRYSYASEPIPGMLHYYRVSYTQDPCLVCRSEADVTAAIAHMGSLGIKDFRLYLASEELRELMMDKPLAYIHELEAKGGLITASMYHNNNVVYYMGADIAADAVSLASTEEALAYLEEQAEAGAAEITLFCAPELYEKLLGKLGEPAISRDGMDPIYDLVAQAGIFDYELSASRATGAIILSVKAYYPGREILRAVANGTEAELPERLQETLEAAQKLAEDCRCEDPLETARKIHDALCAGVVYTDDEETDEDDTAVGALLNGRANCDGYSDAFYLVGTLAGLEVRYQHGDSRVKGAGVVTFGDTVTHMWNLLLIDGSWRMVDVTWDDDEGRGPDYTWFNLGYDRASRSHVWNEEMTVELLEETDLDARPENEFSVRSAREMEAAVDEALQQGYQSFSLIFDGEGYADYEAALERISQGVSGAYQYAWGAELRQLRVYLG